jgi:hypothetical protein
MTIDDFRKSLEENSEETILPTICISIFENKLIFTTKKVGSRYFEDISRVEGMIHSIDFKLIPNTDSLKSDDRYDDRLEFGKYYFNLSPHSYMHHNSFFGVVGVSNISELFSETTYQKWEFIFVVREPLKRTLTGFCEISDSYFASMMSHTYSKYIIQKYFQIIIPSLPSYSFADIPVEKVVDILNEYSQYIGSDLIRDEHTSGWNMFLSSFIRQNKLDKKIKVIDLEDKTAMSVFPTIKQPSNKSYLKEWMHEDNKFYVDNLIKSINFFLIPEIEAYNELLQIK